MQTQTRIAAGLAAAALLIGSAACSKQVSGDPAGTTAAATTSAEATQTTDAAPSTPATGADSLAHYAESNNLTATSVAHGDPGPTVTLPKVDGWDLVYDRPDAPFGALVLQQPANPDNPGVLAMRMTKLTGGEVNRDEVFASSANEIKNLPGVENSSATSARLSGYVADRIAALLADGGLAAQETVLIPSDDASFVLQIHVTGHQEDAGALTTLTNAVDSDTVITP